MAKMVYISSAQERKKFIELQLAFQEDCESLLGKFEKFKTFDFKQFTNLWIDKKFSLIYLGRYRSVELPHFTEMIFNCAKKYIVFGKSKFIQIGGLYLLYGLFYKQPFQHAAKIRLLQTEFHQLKDLMTYMRLVRQTDVLYIYCKMLLDCAFDFVVTHYGLGIETKYLQEDLKLIDNTFPVNRTNIVEDMHVVTHDVLNEISDIDNQYQKLLKQYLGGTNKTIQMYPLTIRQDFDKMVQSMEHSDEAASTSVGNRRTKIKAKAFKGQCDTHWRKSALDSSTEINLSDSD